MPRMPSTTCSTEPGDGEGDGDGEGLGLLLGGGLEPPPPPPLPAGPLLRVDERGWTGVPLVPPPAAFASGATARIVPADGTPASSALMARPIAVASVPTSRATTAHEPPPLRRSRAFSKRAFNATRSLRDAVAARAIAIGSAVSLTRRRGVA